MPPPPAQNLEVTVSVSDAPLGLGKKEEVVAGPSYLSSSQAGGVTTITSLHPHTTSHSEAPSQSPGNTPLHADVGQMLPSDDAMVYGGEGGQRRERGRGHCRLVDYNSGQAAVVEPLLVTLHHAQPAECGSEAPVLRCQGVWR
jgi:hypothetical protein